MEAKLHNRNKREVVVRDAGHSNVKFPNASQVSPCVLPDWVVSKGLGQQCE